MKESQRDNKKEFQRDENGVKNYKRGWLNGKGKRNLGFCERKGVTKIKNKKNLSKYRKENFWGDF